MLVDDVEQDVACRCLIVAMSVRECGTHSRVRGFYMLVSIRCFVLVVVAGPAWGLITPQLFGAVCSEEIAALVDATACSDDSRGRTR